MKTQTRKYKLGELEHAQKQLNELRQSGTATGQELQEAADELERQLDINACNMGMDN